MARYMNYVRTKLSKPHTTLMRKRYGKAWLIGGTTLILALLAVYYA